MNSTSFRAVAAFLAAAFSTAALAQASSSQYEFRKLARTLAVDGAASSGPPPAIQPGGEGQSGSQGAAALSLSSSAIDFGSVATNTTEKRQVVVSNTGDGTLSITRAATVSGAAEFAAGLTTCGSTLAAGSDCLLEPTFSPTTTGTFNGVLTFTTTLAGSPHDITLVGTAFNPVSLASASLPLATRNKSFSPFDFKTLLSVSNEASPVKADATWSVVTGALPAGLNLDAQTGVLSGTPTQATAAGGQGFTVAGTYKLNQGQQVYTILVANSPLLVWQPADGITIDANGDVSTGHYVAARTASALPTTGKWYWELDVLSAAVDATYAEYPVVGVSTSTSGYPGRYANSCGHFAYGTMNFLERNGVESQVSNTSRSWILGVGYDGLTRTVTFYRGGTTLGSCVVGGSAPTYLAVASGGISKLAKYRLISAPSAVPAGYVALDLAPSE